MGELPLYPSPPIPRMSMAKWSGQTSSSMHYVNQLLWVRFPGSLVQLILHTPYSSVFCRFEQALEKGSRLGWRLVMKDTLTEFHMCTHSPLHICLALPCNSCHNNTLPYLTTSTSSLRLCIIIVVTMGQGHLCHNHIFYVWSHCQDDHCKIWNDVANTKVNSYSVCVWGFDSL